MPSDLRESWTDLARDIDVVFRVMVPTLLVFLAGFCSGTCQVGMAGIQLGREEACDFACGQHWTWDGDRGCVCLEVSDAW